MYIFDNMRTKLSLTGLFIVLLPMLSIAKQVAVLETNSQKDLLTPQEKQYLTDVLRGEAVRVLPAEQDWTVMTRESINALLPPEKAVEECEGACITETGKAISADYVAQARVIQFGSSLAISVELYELADNKLVSSFNGRGGNVEDIEKIIKDQSPDFFKKACGSTCDTQSAVENAPQGGQRVIVEIETEPSGAVPMIDGKAIRKCTSTPCKALLEVGEHRLSLSKKLFEDKDSLVNIVENNQKFSLKLESNAGSLDIRPVIQKEFEQYPIKVKIDGEQGQAGTNELAPGTHKIVVKHPCYDPIKFNATIEKGKTAIFSDSLKLGVGGLELEVQQGGKPQSVPVYFDGVKMGVTPFSGEVPLCAKIEVGDSASREAVAVELKWHEIVKVTHEMKPLKTDQASKKESAKPKEQKNPLNKKFWAGAFVAATYNDFYGTKFGFGNLKSGEDYALRVDGTDDILGNYWGVGANIGISGLYLFNPMLALRADLGIASRRGSGKSDVSVKLFWNDGSRQPEKSDLEMEYYVRQINIDIPLALRVMLPSKVYAEAGPMMSFNLYSKTKFSVTDIYGTEHFREHDCFDTFEFAIVSGVGVTRPIGKTMLDVGLRFVVGVTSLNDADDSPKTWQWQFNVAYWFI